MYMAEGGFDDFEMKTFEDKYQKYNDEQLTDERETKRTEYEMLNHRIALLNSGDDPMIPEDVRIIYNNTVDQIKLIDNEIERRKVLKAFRQEVLETSFIDDDGKTVTIKSPRNKSVKVKRVRFVDEKTIIPLSKNIHLVLKSFIISRYNYNIDFDSVEGIELRNNMSITKNNNLTYKPLLSNGERGGAQIVLKRDINGTLNYNTSQNSEKNVKQFKKALENIVNEKIDEAKNKGSTLSSTLKGSSLDKKIIIMRDVLDDFPVVDIEPERKTVAGLSEKENRELNGVLNPSSTTVSRIGNDGALQVQADYFDEALNELQMKLDNTADPTERKELQERIDGLTTAREQTVKQRQLEEVREQQEEDISRLQKIKEWFKENWLGASVLGITIASFITTIIVAARSSIVKGGQAIGNLGKAIANLAKKAGPLLTSLLNVVATALKWGAAGVAWLANNLWVLVLALVWFIYDQYKQKTQVKK